MRVFLFPGQGSQYVGMAGNIADQLVARQLFQRAGDVLGFDLWSLVQDGDEATLTRTENTQPALFVTEMAWVQALTTRNVACDAAAGHSLGEFSALCSAGVFSFEDGVRLVRHRGEIMARAVSNSPGTMAAIVGLGDGDLATVLAEGHAVGVVEVANYNAPDQTVVSGEISAVDRVMTAVRTMGRGRAIKLRVGAPFHSSIMAGGAAEFGQLLAEIRLSKPRFPVVNNVAAVAESEPEAIRQNLIAQFSHPVQWVRTMDVLARIGVSEYLEVGPKNVLATIARKVVHGQKVSAVEEQTWD